MKHARLSGSKAEQFIACNAAPKLIELVGLEEEADEPDYRRDGIAAHAVAAECLRTGKDAWELIGFPAYPSFREEHVEAVQSYLNFIRELSGGADLLIEHYVSDPNREDFGGTLDVAWLTLHSYGPRGTVVDYKHGAGLAIEADCAQLRYYAYGMVLKYPDIKTFDLYIVQPRAWHAEGPIRHLSISTEAVLEWVVEVLLPAMEATKDAGARFVPGLHCRFCPVKLACPALVGMARAAAKAPAVGAFVPQRLSDAQLAAEGKLVKSAEMYFRAVMTEIARRAFVGREIEGFKVVKKKADRVWSNAEAQLKAAEAFGDDAWIPLTFKSPAQIDKLPGGKDFTAQHAHSPETGYTVASTDDKRVPVKITSVPKALLDKSLDEA